LTVLLSLFVKQNKISSSSSSSSPVFHSRSTLEVMKLLTTAFAK